MFNVFSYSYFYRFFVRLFFTDRLHSSNGVYFRTAHNHRRHYIDIILLIFLKNVDFTRIIMYNDINYCISEAEQ